MRTDRARRPSGRAGRPPAAGLHGAGGWLWALAPVAVVYTAHLAYGANQTVAALVLACVEAGLLLIFLARGQFRRSLPALKGLGPIAALFGLTLAVAAWSMTPWIPGGAHPVWSWTQAPGAATIDRGAAVIEIAKLCGLACIFLAGGMLGADYEASRRTLKAVLWGGGLFCVLSLVMAAANSADRLTGPLISANSAGTIMAVLLVLALPLLSSSGARERHAADRRIEAMVSAYGPGLALLVLFLACLVFTASRGALLAAGVAAVGFIALQLEAGALRLRRALAGLGVIAAIALPIVLLRGELVMRRLGGVGADGSGRELLFSAHWSAFLRSPLFGYGLGAFDAVNKLGLDSRTYADLWNVRAAHNVYLQWLEEAGILGAAPMFLCIAAIIALTVWGARSRRRGLAWIHGLIAADAVVLLHGLSDYGLQVPSIAAFWALLLGLQLGMVSRGRAASS